MIIAPVGSLGKTSQMGGRWRCPTSGGSAPRWGKDCLNEKKKGGWWVLAPASPPDFGLWWSVGGGYELTYRVWDNPRALGGCSALVYNRLRHWCRGAGQCGSQS
jgi:hypothetical protein